MIEVASALTDVDEWAKGVLFPLAVLLVAACAGYSVRCLRNILGEFQATRAEVTEIREALVTAGLLHPNE